MNITYDDSQSHVTRISHITITSNEHCTMSTISQISEQINQNISLEQKMNGDSLRTDQSGAEYNNILKTSEVITPNWILSTPPVVRDLSSSWNDCFRVSGRWQGYVMSVDGEFFHARLADDLGRNPDEDAEIFIREISEGDRDLLKPGAIFYWIVGYRDKLGGGRTRESVIRMQRLPAWTEEEIAEAGRRAESSLQLLGNDGSASTTS